MCGCELNLNRSSCLNVVRFQQQVKRGDSNESEYTADSTGLGDFKPKRCETKNKHQARYYEKGETCGEKRSRETGRELHHNIRSLPRNSSPCSFIPIEHQGIHRGIWDEYPNSPSGIAPPVKSKCNGRRQERDKPRNLDESQEEGLPSREIVRFAAATRHYAILMKFC